MKEICLCIFVLNAERINLCDINGAIIRAKRRADSGCPEGLK